MEDYDICQNAFNISIDSNGGNENSDNSEKALTDKTNQENLTLINDTNKSVKKGK